jgi:hypothetical protein
MMIGGAASSLKSSYIDADSIFFSSTTSWLSAWRTRGWMAAIGIMFTLATRSSIGSYSWALRSPVARCYQYTWKEKKNNVHTYIAETFRLQSFLNFVQSKRNSTLGLPVLKYIAYLSMSLFLLLTRTTCMTVYTQRRPQTGANIICSVLCMCILL